MKPPLTFTSALKAFDPQDMKLMCKVKIGELQGELEQNENERLQILKRQAAAKTDGERFGLELIEDTIVTQRKALNKQLRRFRYGLRLLNGNESKHTDVEDIKTKVNWETLIDSYISTYKRHGNKIQAKCPFHNDRSPSLSIDLEKGLWNCFAGCGGGSCIDFIMKAEGIEFKEALKLLSERC